MSKREDVTVTLRDMKLTASGYDGSGYSVGDRVELHPAFDRWARGDKFGEVLRITPTRVAVLTDHGAKVDGEHSMFRLATKKGEF